MELVALMPAFGGFLFTVAAFVAALSVIVAVHEYGHYIVGRLSGIHADVFSIGFGPVLFSRVDRRGTRWQVAALPFGGYVKFKGDANAASVGADAEAMAEMLATERRKTMTGAPLWARSATVAAGPVFNFIFAILVFCVYMLANGVATEEPRVGGVRDLPYDVQPLQTGDLILAVNGEPTPRLPRFYDVIVDLPSVPTVTYRIERDGQQIEIEGAHPHPGLVGSATLNSAAREAGLQGGDVILTANGLPIHAFNDLRPIVAASNGQPIALQVWRAGETMDLMLTPRRTDIPLPEGGFETRWLIGVTNALIFEHPTRFPQPVEMISIAAEETWKIARTSISGMYHIVTGAISSCNIAGPIGIAEASGQMASDGFWSFVWFIAVLSTAVGLMNLFPIPVLDGGHLVFHAWEAVTGKPPGERAIRTMMTIGIALLGSLMLFAVATDLFC
jgi:regulator of sigma E protease